MKNVSGRVAVAAALGSIAGPLAFIPLIEVGHEKNADCDGLMEKARAHTGDDKNDSKNGMLKPQVMEQVFVPGNSYVIHAKF
jgi:hypothetical protein